MKKLILLLIINFLFSCSSDTELAEDLKFKIVTIPISNLSPYNASSSVSIITEEGVIHSSLERGICWSTSPNPTINSNNANDDNGDKVYPYIYPIVNLNKLLPNTKYYARSYVKNLQIRDGEFYKKYELVYGDEISFTTHNPDTLKVGQKYGGGIIAYIIKPTDLNYIKGETHGLIMRNTDATCDWGCADMRLSASSDGLIGSGRGNTMKIFKNCRRGNAAYTCHTMVADNYNDWYLPSIFELTIIRTNLYLKNIGKYTSTCYWSSNEESAWDAIPISFYKNPAGCADGKKANLKGIIPVRLF